MALPFVTVTSDPEGTPPSAKEALHAKGKAVLSASAFGGPCPSDPIEPSRVVSISKSAVAWVSLLTVRPLGMRFFLTTSSAWTGSLPIDVNSVVGKSLF